MCAQHRTALYPSRVAAAGEYLDRKLRAATSRGTPTPLEPRQCRIARKVRGWHLLPPLGPVTTRADAEQLVRRLYQWGGDERVTTVYIPSKTVTGPCAVCETGVGQVRIRWCPSGPAPRTEVRVCVPCAADYLDGVVLPDAGDPVDRPAPIEVHVWRAEP
jgi:hypothetical protein